MNTQVPTFVVAGAGRAGTTGLVEGLRTHPDVFVTSPKEPHYLALHGEPLSYRGPGDEASINRTAVTNQRDYLALYAGADSRSVLGEGSVSTLYYHERAVSELLRLNPQVRVIVLLREPVARAWSSFQYLRSQGREPESDFLVALADEERRRSENWHHLWHYAAMSRYAGAVSALQQQLAPERLGIWFYDDLERDYAETLRGVCRFLGLESVPRLGDGVKRVNISGTPRYRRTQQALVWASDQPALRQAARLATSWRLREAIRLRMLKRGAVPIDVVNQVTPRFEEDRARLRSLLAPSMVLPAWLSAPSVGAR